MKWEQQCRLMHMCTRKYLCVDQGGKVSLTSDHLDPKTVFRLHPVIRVGSTDNLVRMYRLICTFIVLICLEKDFLQHCTVLS